MEFYSEVKTSISELTNRNEKYLLLMRNMEKNVADIEEEMGQDLRIMDKFINSRSVSAAQRAKFEENRYEIISDASKKVDMLDELKTKIQSEIDENNKKIEEMKKIDEKNKDKSDPKKDLRKKQ